MKKLNDSDLAKQDIVDRPEVTQGVAAEITREQQETPQQQHAPAAPEDIERAERQSRIFARRIERVLKGMTNDDVTADEATEISELGGMIFRGLLKIPFGNVIGGAIVAACLAIPFLPRIMKFTTKKQEETHV